MTGRLRWCVNQKKNRIETAHKTYASSFRCGSPILEGSESGVGHIWNWNFHYHSWPRSASFFFLSQKRQTATATCDPRGDLKIMSAHKKTPLMQPTSGTVSYVTLQTSAPASTLSLPPTVDPPARCNRGQVQSTSPIHDRNRNLEAKLSIAGCD